MVEAVHKTEEPNNSSQAPDQSPKKEGENSSIDQTEQQKPSKRQLKKQLKEEKWLEKKEQMKLKRKEKNKDKGKQRASYTHLMRFDHMERTYTKMVKNEDGQEVEQTFTGRLTKKEKQKLYKELCLKGPRIVVDCDYEDKMREPEVKSLGQQLTYCTNVNKQLEQPMNLIFTGVGDQLVERLKAASYENWSIQAFSGNKASYLEASPVESVYKTTEGGQIPKERLVYLTADSKNEIKELDPEDVYIIGGIVDRNRYINLTLNKAEEQGIRHGRLPIGDYMQLQSSTVLTVNHVFEILGLQFNNKDWSKTLNHVIPERKQKKPEEPGQEPKNDEEEKKE